MSDTQPPIVALPSSPIQHGTGAEAPPSSHGLFGEVASAVASAMKSSSISRSRTDLTSRSRPDLTAIAGMRTRLGQIQGMEKGSTGNISRASSMADELDDPGPNGKSDSPLSENVASRVRRLSAAHTAIQAAHQTTASTVPGPASLASRTNTFMAVVQSAKLMSSPTTTESALSKARFYDSIIESLGDGVEEGVALAEAVRAAKEVSAGGGGGAAASPLVSKDSGQRNISGSTMRLAGAEPTAVTALASRRQSLSSSPVPPQNPSIPPHLVLGTIPATDSEAPSPRPSTNVSPHPSRAPTPAAATSGRNKLKGLFNNVIKPSLAMDPKYGTGGGSSAGGAAAGAGQAAGSASSMAKMRMLHRKLQNTVDEYDTVTLDEAYGRERQLLESTRLQLEKTREDVRRAVTAEWEKRCKHDACNSKISMLSRENFLMKDETNRTMKINRELTTAVQALSVFKSNAESEQKLMVNELARRRLRTRTMRKKLNTLRARLKELEERTGITSRDDDASDREGESSELDDEEWEEWCRKTEFCKPTWNISTTTKLLSQHPPASVIHIGDGGNAPFISDDEERRARVEATIKPKRRTKTQVHEKCKHRVDHLNRRLNEERAQKRRITADSTRQSNLIYHLSHLLTTRASDPLLSDLISRAINDFQEAAARSAATSPESGRSRTGWSDAEETTGATSESGENEEQEQFKRKRKPTNEVLEKSTEVTSESFARTSNPQQNRPTSAPNKVAGECQRDAGRRPVDYARPQHLQDTIRQVDERAAAAAIAKQLISAPPLASPHITLLSTNSSIPPPSHGTPIPGQSAFVSIGSWIQRNRSSRPKSAPVARHGMLAAPPTPPAAEPDANLEAVILGMAESHHAKTHGNGTVPGHTGKGMVMAAPDFTSEQQNNGMAAVGASWTPKQKIIREVRISPAPPFKTRPSSSSQGPPDPVSKVRIPNAASDTSSKVKSTSRPKSAPVRSPSKLVATTKRPGTGGKRAGLKTTPKLGAS